MDKQLEKIWQLAVPYLEKGVRKDFVTHIKGVVRAMELILEKESGDIEILMLVAMLHDVGWAKVPEDLQKNWMDPVDKQKGEELHLQYAPEIIRHILSEEGYTQEKINQVIEIVLAHKFQDPAEHEKQLLIDADNLADILKEPFYADMKAYKVSPLQQLEYRKNNKFYTEAAREIFKREYIQREREILGQTGKTFNV